MAGRASWTTPRRSGARLWPSIRPSNKSGEALSWQPRHVEYSVATQGARRRREETLPIYPELTSREPRGLNNIASVLGEQGDIAGDGHVRAGAGPLPEGSVRRAACSGTRQYRAELALRRVTWPQPKRSYKDVMALWKETGDKEAAAPFIEKYGDLLLEKGDAAGARQRYAGALALLAGDETGGRGGRSAARPARARRRRRESQAGRGVRSPVARRCARSRKSRSARRTSGGCLPGARPRRTGPRTRSAKRSRRGCSRSRAQNRSVRLRQDIAFARVLGALGDADRNPGNRGAHARAIRCQPDGYRASGLRGARRAWRDRIRTSPAAARVQLRELQKEAAAQGLQGDSRSASSGRAVGIRASPRGAHEPTRRSVVVGTDPVCGFRTTLTALPDARPSTHSSASSSTTNSRSERRTGRRGATSVRARRAAAIRARSRDRYQVSIKSPGDVCRGAPAASFVNRSPSSLDPALRSH